MSVPCRVLIVEDSADDERLMLAELKRAGYAILHRRVGDAAGFRDALREPWDIVFLDFTVPDFSVMDALGALAGQGLDTPCVLVSGTVGEERVVEAMRAGARDYLPKDNLRRLGAVVERELREAENRRARREAELLNQEVLDSLPAHIAVLAPDGTVVTVNEAWRRFSRSGGGAREACDVGANYLDACRAESDAADEGRAAMGGIQGVLTGAVPAFHLEYPCTTPAGNRWFLMSVTPLRSPRGGAVVTHIDITGRKEAEEALLLQARVLGSMAEGVNVADESGTIIYANPAQEAMFGYAPGELVGRHVSVFHAGPPDRTERLFGEVVRQIENAGRWEGDFQNRRKDGSTFFTACRITPLESRGRKRLVCVQEDVTARRSAQHALQVSEERYRLLFERNPHPMFVYDVATLAYLAVNEAAVRQYGYSRDEFLGMTIRDIRPSEDLPALENTLARADGGLEYRGLWRHRKKDGTVIDVDVTVHGVELDTRPACIVLAVDVTEARRAEARVRESERRLRAVLDTLPVGVWVTDRSGAVVMANPAGQRIWGTDRRLDAEANDAALLSTSDGRPPGTRTRGPLARALRAGQTSVGEVLEIDCPGEGRKTILASAAPIRDAGGAIAGAVEVNEDITERVRLEEQFRQSQKMEAFGQLAGGVAHDMNNILTVINGFAEILYHEAAADHPSRDVLEEIRKAGERAADLTRQLLAFSRRQIVTPKLLDVNELVADMGKMLRRLIGEDIELVTHLTPGIGPVLADPGQLQQVLMNLAVNARDAMPRGGRLAIETGVRALPSRRDDPGSRPGPYVVLAVSDTGVGMDEATQARIFEPFFTTKEVGKGTGLGLATVYGIVKQAGGEIEVISEPGHGATFEILLPLHREPPATDHSAFGVRQGLSEGRETVLVIEDEDAVRGLAVRILQSSGYTVLEASDGASGVRVCEEYPGRIHLLVTDVVLPGRFRGRQLAERLQSLRPGLRVLFMSGFNDDLVLHYGVSHEEVAFLPKPFSPDALKRTVRAVLDGEPSRR